MDKGPVRKKIRRENNDFHLESDTENSFLDKVTKSVKDFLTPSWFGSFINTSNHSDEKTQLQKPRETIHSERPDQVADNQSAYSEKLSPRPSPAASQPAGAYMVSGAQPAAFPESPSHAGRHASSEAQQSTSLLGFAGQPGLGGESKLGVEDSICEQPGLAINNSAAAQQFGHSKSGLAERRQEQQSPYHNYSDTSALLDSTSNRRSFNVSIFAKSFSETIDSSSLDSSSLGNSSFYPGKTVYGGASGQRGHNFSRATPYTRVTKVKKGARAKAAKPFTGNSSAAKLILKALHETGLEQMKAVQAGHKGDKLFSPAVYLRKKDAPSHRSSSSMFAASESVKGRETQKQNNQLPTSAIFSKGSSPIGASVGKSSAIAARFPSQAGGGKMRKERMHYSAKKSTEGLTGGTATQSPSKQAGIISHVGHGHVSIDLFTFCSPEPAVVQAVPLSSPSPTLRQFTFAFPTKLDLPSEKTAKDKPAVITAILDSTSHDVEKDVVESDQSVAAVTKPSNTGHTGWGNLIPSMSNKWSCSDCLIQNSDEVEKCVACSAPKPGAKPTKPVVASDGWGDLLKNTASKWSCDACLIKNESGVSNCVACSAPKPPTKGTPVEVSKSASSGQKDLPVEVSSTSASSGWGDLMKGSADKWSCSVCLIKNEASVDKCVACTTPKPAQKVDTVTKVPDMPVKSPETTGNWNTFFQNAAQKWKCSVCTSPNDMSQATCAACQAPAPAKEESAKSVSTASGWGALMGNQKAGDVVTSSSSTAPTQDLTGTAVAGWGKPKAGWACDTCLVSNEENATKCVCCGANKPGMLASDKGDTLPTSKALPPLSKGFSLSSMFSAKSDSVTKPVDSAITNPSSAPDKASAPSFTQFSFKLPPSSTSQKTSADDVQKSFLPQLGQGSGQSAGNSFTSFAKPSATDDTTASTAKPATGSPLESSVSSSSSGSSQEGASLFSFGKPPAASLFKFGTASQTSAQPSEDKPSGLFNFGQSTGGHPEASESAKQAPTPLFGVASSSNTDSPKPLFTFGLSTATQKPAEISADKSIFTFGKCNNPTSISGSVAASNSPFATSGGISGAAPSASGTSVSASGPSANAFGTSSNLFGFGASQPGTSASMFGSSASTSGTSVPAFSTTTGMFGSSATGPAQSSLFSQENKSSVFSPDVFSNSNTSAVSFSANNSVPYFSSGTKPRFMRKATRKLNK